MICILCNTEIDDDSHYCDHCGKVILVCSLCGEQGKNKRCQKDGHKLIPIEKYKSQNSGVNKPQIPISVNNSNTVSTNNVKRLSLHNSELTTPIILDSTAVIGRVEGDCINYFGTKKTISGKHARIEYRETGWFVKDLGSTNGTFVNSIQVVSDSEKKLSSGDNITFADVELKINIF